jgi:hypothetical protein
MSLATMQWEEVSIHKVILGWLRAERDNSKVLTQVFAALPAAVRLLDAPDLNNADENRERLRIFYIARWLFLFEIPPDTTWYEVRNLRDDDLANLHAVNYAHWNDTGDENELLKVAARKPLKLSAQPDAWGSIILWGHERTGPFTIIEGNHRLTAYAGSGQAGLNIPVFVGLSSLKCHWHLLDRCPVLMQDLIPRSA